MGALLTVVMGFIDPSSHEDINVTWKPVISSFLRWPNSLTSGRDTSTLHRWPGEGYYAFSACTSSVRVRGKDIRLH